MTFFVCLIFLSFTGHELRPRRPKELKPVEMTMGDRAAAARQKAGGKTSTVAEKAAARLREQLAKRVCSILLLYSLYT
jgi:hypothetical protein